MNLMPSITKEQLEHWRPTLIRAAPALSLVAAILVALAIIAYVSARQSGTVPTGFAKANGRIEVERVDVAAKYAGRVAEILVKKVTLSKRTVSSPGSTQPN